MSGWSWKDRNRLGLHRAMMVMALMIPFGVPARAEEAAPVDSAKLEFFETKIRPIFAASCLECHGEDKHKANLRLDSRDGMLTGGDSGPAVVPGKPDESLLIEAVKYASIEMPPTGKLADDKIALLKEWVAMGAPFPNSRPTRPVAKSAERTITDEDRQFWSFRPVVRPALPLPTKKRGTGTSPETVSEDPRNTGLGASPPFPAGTSKERGTGTSPEAVSEDPRNTGLGASPPFPAGTSKKRGTGTSPEAVLEDARNTGLGASPPFPAGTSKKRGTGTSPETVLEDPRNTGLGASPPFPAGTSKKRGAGTSPEAVSEDPRNTGLGASPPFQNAIDAFVASRLEQAGLEGSPEAAARELVRRLSFDLVGLPPEVEEIESFEKSDRPDRWSRLVDRMLASPRYGERWGRHWLDVVRFAQTNGYERDSEKPYSWRYRDYVIESFNSDKPYDRFVREQIAGDELAEKSDETVIATGFARIGVWDDEPDDAKNAEFEELDDVVSTMGQAVLGLTIGCARCHDHKFDPISQQDYYGLVAFYRNMRLYEKHVMDKNKSDFSMLVKLSNGEEALAIRERGGVAPPTHVLVRGDARSPASEVSPKFVEVLCPSKERSVAAIAEASADSPTTGRRRVLADWLASSENPLAARVVVNRLWQHHFGKGIVETPSDFGKSGTPPSHPELLDWLASEVVEGEWRLKRTQRLMVESAVYRQSSRATNAKAEAADPDNRLLWRQTMRRLEAEAIRDSVLSANGRLNLAMGGRGFFPEMPKEVLATQSIPGNGWDKSPPEEQSRRSVYIFVKRTLRPPLLESLDFATPDQPIAARPVTTIAPQALLLLNSSFLNEQAMGCAEEVIRESTTAEDQVRALFRRTLQRVPSESEMRTSTAFLARQEAAWRERGESDDGGAHRNAVAELAKLMMNTNEFAYVD